jgi:hypothetical protein
LTEVDAIAAMVDALNAADIPFMFVGSLSTNAYGIERSTKDADFVVQLGNFPVGKLLDFLPKGFRLESQMGFETITLTMRYRLYCDLVPRPFMFELFEISDDPHDQERFAKRIATTYHERRAFLPRAEDTVITKLRWSKSGRRSKDVDDARNVLAVQMGRLDMEYIRGWCDRHGTRELLEETLRSIPPLPENS